MYVFLLSIIWPLAKKVLLMLGIGFITYEGVTLLTDNLIGAAQSAWGGITGSTLQIASLAGMPEAMGIISGAIVARVALVAVGRLGKVSA